MAGNDVSISVQVRDSTSAAFAAIGSAVKTLASGALIPAAAAAAAVGVQLGAAGAAVGIFGAAVGPQVKAIGEVATAQEKYNDAVVKYGKGSKQALAAQAELKAQMASLPPATQDAARAFGDLKSSYGQWSDSLSGDTMPVFTTAMKTLQGILPKFSPLVKDVAAQFQVLANRFQAFSKTQQFDTMVQKFSEFASGALRNVISGAEKLAKVIAGWITSDGFQEFLRMGAEEGPGIAKMFQDIAEAVGKFIVAAGPLAGLQLKVLQVLATALNAIPLDVLQVLVPTILGLVLAAKAYTVAITAWTAAQALWNAVMLVNPVVWIIAGILALIAVIVLIATKTTWFQTLWKTVWGGIKTAFNATVEFIKEHWRLLLTIFGGPLGYAIGQVIKHWDTIKTTAVAAFKTVKEWVQSAIDTVKKFVGKVVKFHQEGIQRIVSAVSGVIGWVKRFVGKVVRFAQNGAGAVSGAVSNIISWVKRMAGKTIRLLQSGAAGVVGWVSNIIGKVRSMVGKTIRIGVSGASAAINAVQGVINRIKNFVGKTVSIGVNFFKGAGSKIASALGFAHGGITGAAGGGPRSNTTLVGEYGPELVDLAPGSRVRSNADSRRIASAGNGGGGPIVIQLMIAGQTIGDIVLDPLRKTIATKGGNVQAVLGR